MPARLDSEGKNLFKSESFNILVANFFIDVFVFEITFRAHGNKAAVEENPSTQGIKNKLNRICTRLFTKLIALITAT